MKRIKEKEGVKINSLRLKKIIEIDNLDEFYYLINILDEIQTKKFIEHYKKNKGKSSSKISKLIHSSNSKEELLKRTEQEMVSNLKERYENINSNISEQRKKGKDVYYEWVKSMSIPLKIRLYEATLNKKDLYKTKKLIESLEKEIKI